MKAFGCLMILAALSSTCAFGCSPALAHADPTAALIEKCEGEARAAHYVGGASVEEAMRVYDDCIARGAQGAGDVPR